VALSTPHGTLGTGGKNEDGKRKNQKLSTPHGTLGTYIACGEGLENWFKLSTPHGTLGTNFPSFGKKSKTALSTPHGTLGTEMEALYNLGRMITFNSTRYIRNLVVQLFNRS